MLKLDLNSKEMSEFRKLIVHYNRNKKGLHYIDKINKMLAEAKKIDSDFEFERESYRRDAVSYSLRDFVSIIRESREGKTVSTGFDELDKIFNGGLYPGLYVVGAISSLGKTTFALQVADQIAQSGHGVLIFSLEMSRNELMVKTLSRLTFIKITEQWKISYLNMEYRI